MNNFCFKKKLFIKFNKELISIINFFFFCRSENFIENKKDGNPLVQGLVNMVDEVEQTSLYLIFFLRDSC